MTETLSLTLPDSVIERIVERATKQVLDRLDASTTKAATRYLTVAEAADYLRCKPQRVYDLLSARRLTRYKDGSRVLVSREEVDAYLADSRPSRVAPALPHPVQVRMDSRIRVA